MDAEAPAPSDRRQLASLPPGLPAWESEAVAWDEVVAVAAHGLLTPMAVIKGFAETLLQRWHDFPAEERDEYLIRIMVNADLAAARLHDLAVGLPPGTSVPLARSGARGPTRDRLGRDR